MKIDRCNLYAINFALCIYASFTDAKFFALRCKINRRATNLYNLSVYTGDNLHPNVAGGELIARRMASVVNML